MRALVLFGVAGILVLGFVFWLYRGAQIFVYQLGEYAPTPYAASESGRANRVRAEQVAEPVEWILSDGSRQRAYYLPSRNGALVVYAHGSPGYGLGALDESLVLAEQGFGVLLVDLPGYGASEGDRTWGASFVESIEHAVDFAVSRPEVHAGKIAGFGYSNGGCLIARAAAEDDRIGAIVLLASYTNLADQLHAAFQGRRTPWMSYFAIAASYWSSVPVAELDTVDALRRMEPRPTLIMAGGQDGQIPVEMSAQLKQAAPNAEILIFDDIGHLGFARKLGDGYYDPLLRFFEDALRPEAGGIHGAGGAERSQRSGAEPGPG